MIHSSEAQQQNSTGSTDEHEGERKNEEVNNREK
jgi:hypothetical protein